jgi:hypothetical protein
VVPALLRPVLVRLLAPTLPARLTVRGHSYREALMQPLRLPIPWDG